MKIIFTIFFALFPLLWIFAQDEDTGSILPPDTLFNTPADTLEERTYDIDTVIYANASDSLIFYVNKKKMDIYGDASLIYKDMDLKSANIFVDFETNNLEAVGVPSDSLPDKFVKTPVLKEGADVYEGFRMKYNFKTRRGHIASAGTEQEGAIYSGEKIKKVDDDIFFVEHGIYTTCEVDFPHYHFYSSEMKVIQQEQMVAKWIWLHFGGVPFPFPLPFAVFPIESGRRSGLLPPAYGDDAQYGKYFSRFGYFWAISDYMDWNVTADIYTRGSYNLGSRFRYAKRYNYTGNLEGGYSNFVVNEPNDPDRQERIDWRVKWNHNQSIDPTLRFDANLEFISGNYLQRNVTDYNELLRNEVVSNATIFKSWDESGNSLSLNYSRRQILQPGSENDGNVNEVLPNLTFNMSQKYPFKRKNAVGDQKWYELIGFNYNSQFQNNRNKIAGDLNIRGGIQHNISTSASPKIGFFSFTPSVRYQERWYNKRIEQVYAGQTFDDKDSIVTRDVHEINMVRTFGLGVSTSTKFYGMFQPNAFGISAIRHTVNPSLSYNYQPDFSKPGWGYFDSYVNSAGEEIRYNKFQREIFGGPSAGEQQNISFSVSNIFEMKTSVDPRDTTSKEEKIQLLNLTASMGYNLAADSLNFSDLNLNYRTQIGDYFNFSGSSSFSPYDYSADNPRLNKFLINEGKGLLRLTRFDFSVSTSLSGERLRPKEDLDAPEDEFQLGQTDQRVYKGLYDEQEEADFTIPWDISLTYNYSLNKFQPLNPIHNSNITGGFNFNLTPAWKFTFTGSYDLRNKDFAAPQVRVSRDLHCWLMEFTWNPIGTFRGYRFEIRVKAPQLQDLKITKRDEFYSGRR
jgi:lipopolysaccharide assembly outer membrane protein LptD (OstA)